jgi:hypothetical protein
MAIRIVEEGRSGQDPLVLEMFGFNEYIEIPAGHDIYITVPDGVYRCDINDGIFPEDRRFFQRRDRQLKETYIIRYNEIAHHQSPVIRFREHYPAENNREDILVSFKTAGLFQ